MEEPKLLRELMGSGDETPETAIAIKSSEPVAQPAKKKDEKVKRKDEKNIEQVLKALGGLGTSEEKLAAVCKKYADIVEENRKLQVQIKQYEKKVTGLSKEKSQLEAEQGKHLVTRSRLEGLCRELQKQNKQIKEESLNRIKEEEEKRKSVSEKFKLTLGEITHLMQQNNENNSKLTDENLEIQSKFKAVCEKYELREQQIEKMSQQMKLESQLAEAQLTKLKIEMLAEKEVLVNEKQQLLLELSAYKEKCQELQKMEAALKLQIHTYTEKYDKFQGALAKSNELYGGFKSEIEKMSKKIVKLEKETSVWKSRWENNHKILLQVAAEKQQKIEELSLASRQLTQLQKLCRVLQADRTSLLTQLKSEGFTPKLSGEYGCGSDDSKSREDVKQEQSEFCAPQSPVLENGEGDRPLYSMCVCDYEKLKGTSPETKEQEAGVTESEKPMETGKAKPKVKTKKGKNGRSTWKRRKRRRSRSWPQYYPDWKNGRRGKNGSLTFHTTQILTGHGCFGHYLHRIQKRDSAECHHCSEGEEDTAEHTLRDCKAWTSEREKLRETIPHLSLENIIGEMLESGKKWDAFTKFAEEVMRKKEETEREEEKRRRSKTRQEARLHE